jgi:predicted PurR-regulated permease PerM
MAKTPLRDAEKRVELTEVQQQPDTAGDPYSRGRPFHVRSLALAGILFLLVLYSLKLASTFLIPVVLALLLNFLFSSVIRGLSRFHVPPPLGAALVLLALLGSLGFGIYQLALPLRDWVAKFPQTVRQVESKLQHIKQSVREVSKVTEAIDRITNLSNSAKKPEVEIKKSTIGESLLAPTQEVLVGAGVMLILLFFLLASGDLFLRKLVAILPDFHDKKLAVEISRQIEQNISLYLVTITLINICFGSAVGTCMYLLGLPNPLLWGAMAGLLHFIPFLGSLVGISIVTMVGAVTLDSLFMIALVPASYLSLNLIQEYVIVPIVLGRRLLLNPVVVLLWLIFWGWLWGIPGALMAVPLLAVLKIVCDHIKPLAAMAEFIGP